MGSQRFRRWLLVCASGLIFFAGPALAQEIRGAGATLAEPLYRRWTEAYASPGGMRLDYAAVGSWAGIKLVASGQVDFGATDAPLSPDALTRDGLVQFPVAMAAVVPVFRLPGLPGGGLRLSGTVLAEIFLGRIRYWNDAALKALNPGVALPPDAITVVRRSDASGTSFLFTRYLSQVSAGWRERAGQGMAVDWPTGIGARGNAGVADFVSRIPGAIGYVDHAHARQFGLPMAVLQGDDGADVRVSTDSIAAAALLMDEVGKAPTTPRAPAGLTDPAAPRAWPITGATYVLMQRIQAQPARGAAVQKWLGWALRHGDLAARELGYEPLAAEARLHVIDRWSREVVDPQGRPLLQP